MAHDWDDMAESYDELVHKMEPEFGKATKIMFDAARISEGQSVLDVACGPGHTTHAATKRGAKALGMDLSLEMVKIAKRRFPDCNFQSGNMLEPPSGPWDAVVCRFGAHHVDPAWIAASHNVLSAGGCLAIAEFDDTSNEAHENGMRSEEHWTGLFENAGFLGVKVQKLRLDFTKFQGEKIPAPSENVLIISGRKAD